MSARAQLEAAERQWASPAIVHRVTSCEDCGTALLSDRELELRLCVLCRDRQMRDDSRGMFDDREDW